MAIGIGIQRDRTYRRAVFPIELTRRMNETNRGFPAVDDEYPLKFALHNLSDPEKSTVPQLQSSRRDVLQGLQWLGIDAVGKRHRPVSGQSQVPVSPCIDDFRIELLPHRVRSDYRKQRAFGQLGGARPSHLLNVQRQSHAVVLAYFQQAGSLET